MGILVGIIVGYLLGQSGWPIESSAGEVSPPSPSTPSAPSSGGADPAEPKGSAPTPFII